MSTDMTHHAPVRPEVEGSGRLPAGARLGSVRLQVADLDRSEQFYTEVLGLRAMQREPGELLLTDADDSEPLVALVERPGTRALAPHSRLGLFHFALLVPGRGSLGDFALHAQRVGLPLGMSDHLVSEALYLRDPDGLGIEVYADRPREEWRSRAGQWVMATEPLDLESLLADAHGGPFGGLPSGTTVGHVHLHVGDLRAASRFYHGLLGFDEVVRDYPGALFLSAGGYHHHIGTNVWAGPVPSAGPEDARLLSWALVLPEEADVSRVVESARAGTGRDSEVGPRGGRVLSDPWGTRVEVLAEGTAPAALIQDHIPS